MLKNYLLFAFIASLLVPCSVFSANLSITIKSTSGSFVKDAVVTLTSNTKNKITSNQTYIIDQINKTYIPHVKIIPVGSKISFPNKDDIHHHVYSFSDTHKFELPLYEGTPTNPITFNKEGVVVLGCNIHDWMRGYIFVSDTPYYGLSNTSGEISITDIPKGKYTLNIWHPRIKSKNKVKPIKVNLTNKSNIELEETITLKPSFKIRRAPKAKRRKY